MKKITILCLLISSVVLSQCPNPTITSWAMTGTTWAFFYSLKSIKITF
jgi:hypothetical protein